MALEPLSPEQIAQIDELEVFIRENTTVALPLDVAHFWMNTDGVQQGISLTFQQPNAVGTNRLIQWFYIPDSDELDILEGTRHYDLMRSAVPEKGICLTGWFSRIHKPNGWYKLALTPYQRTIRRGYREIMYVR